MATNNCDKYDEDFKKSKPAPRTEENQHIASLILRIYSDHNKRLGAYKICYLLQRDYGIMALTSASAECTA